MSCPLRISDKLSQRGYECLRLLGRGQFGEVYLANVDNDQLAIKVIDLQRA